MKGLSLLGLAQRAGKLASGYEAVRRAVLGGRARLIVISMDASAKTAGRVRRIAEAKRVPCVEVASMRELGQAIGQPDRAVVAVLDQGFARAVREALLRGE